MVEVDINKLSELITIYNEYKTALDKNNTEIVSEFNELKKYWHDQKSINLNSSFLLEKKRIINNSENHEKMIKLYEYIKDKYSSLGTKIRFDLKKKENFINKINAVINDLNWMINRYNNIGDISFYPGAYLIRNQKKSLIQIRDSFEGIKSDINEKINYVTDTENSINEHLKEIKIEMFNLNNYENEV